MRQPMPQRAESRALAMTSFRIHISAHVINAVAVLFVGVFLGTLWIEYAWPGTANPFSQPGFVLFLLTFSAVIGGFFVFKSFIFARDKIFFIVNTPFLLGTIVATMRSLEYASGGLSGSAYFGSANSASTTVALWAIFTFLIYLQLRTASHISPPVSKTASLYEDFGDKIAASASVLALLVAALLVLRLHILGAEQFYEFLVAVLVVVSPQSAVALGMTASQVAGRLAVSGILFRRAFSLEHLGNMNYLIIDRRLLLKNSPIVSDIVPHHHSPVNPVLLLQIAASLEQYAEHPYARAIVAEAKNRELTLISSEQFSETPGRGVMGMVANKSVLVGNRAWMEQRLVRIQGMTQRAETLEEQAKSVVFVGVDGECVGLIAIDDHVRTDTKHVLRRLHAMKISVAMTTGDHRGTAEAQARQLGVERVLAELPRTEVAHEIQKLKRSHRVIGFAADIRKNDAALNAADVSIGIGDVDRFGYLPEVLVLRGALGTLIDAIETARRNTAGLRGSAVWIIVYHIVALPLAAGVFYSGSGSYLPPLLAGLLSLFAVLVTAGYPPRSRVGVS